MPKMHEQKAPVSVPISLFSSDLHIMSPGFPACGFLGLNDAKLNSFSDTQQTNPCLPGRIDSTIFLKSFAVRCEDRN
jgi:hypothetical protein